jgi:hypothetical protein
LKIISLNQKIFFIQKIKVEVKGLEAMDQLCSDLGLYQMASLQTHQITFRWYRLSNLSSYLVLSSFRTRYCINLSKSSCLCQSSLVANTIVTLRREKIFKIGRKFVKGYGLYWIIKIHPIFVKNVTVDVNKSLINLQIEFIFSKLF